MKAEIYVLVETILQRIGNNYPDDELREDLREVLRLLAIERRRRSIGRISS